MKRPLIIVLILLLVVPLSGCYSEARREREAEIAESAYDEGYNDGYSDGLFVSDYDEDGPYTGEFIVWKETPDSTCFSYVGYDSKYEKLAVIFRNNSSRTYLYSDFTPSDYRSFMAADSLGSYYNKNIKGYYTSERIDNPEGTYFEP